VFQELFSVEPVPEIEVERHLGRCSDLRMRTYPFSRAFAYFLMLDDVPSAD
jgi:hypothetical protein